MLAAVLACVWFATRGAAERDAALAATAQVGGDVAAAPVELVEATLPPDPAAPVSARTAAALSPGAAAADRDAPAELRVLVVDASTGEPIPNLRARLESAERDRGSTNQVTDEDGRLRFAGVQRGEPLLLRMLATFREKELARRELEPFRPGERRELSIEIEPSKLPAYWFRVTAGADGRPLAGVHFSEFPLRRAFWEVARGISDHTGLVGLEARSGSASLMLEAQDFAPAWVSLRRGGPSPDAATPLELAQPAQLDVRLQAHGDARVAERTVVVYASGPALGLGVPLTGRLFVPGSPERWSVSRVTDASGRAHFEELPGRRAFTGIRSDGGVRLQVGLLDESGSKTLSLLGTEGLRLEPGERRELVVPLGGEATVIGSVVDQFGAPVTDRELQLVRAREVPRRTMSRQNPEWIERELSTGPDGRFEIPDVPAGRWELFLTPPPPKRRSPEAPAVSDDAVVEVATAFEVDGWESTVEVELSTVRGLTIRGVVLGASGEPVVGGVVMGLSSEVRHGPHARLGSDGRFELGPLLEATYELTVYGPGAGGAAPVSARPGDEVTIQMPAMGSLRLVLVGEPDPMNGPAYFAWARLTGDELPFTRSFSATESPEIRVGKAAEGRYQVTAWTDDGRFAIARSVQVTGNGNTEVVELRLQRGGRVRVALAAKLEGLKQLVLRSDGDQVAETYIRSKEPHVLIGPAGPAAVELWVAGELRESQAVELSAEKTVPVELGGQ